MSVAAKKWVERNPARVSSQQSVLEALAWAAADDRGHGARISYREIAERKALHRNTVLSALRELERDDRIRRHVGGRDHCERCKGSRRGVAVYDVVIPVLAEAVPDGQMNLLTEAPAEAVSDTRDWHTHVPVGVPVLNEVQQPNCATTGTVGVPQGTLGQENHHHQERAGEEKSNELAETVDSVIAILSRVEKPGWFVDRIAIEALVLTWSSHRDPLRAAAAVVASAMGHVHLNAAKLLARALEWQRLDAPTGAPRRHQSPVGAAAGELPEQFSKYDVAMGLSA